MERLKTNPSNQENHPRIAGFFLNSEHPIQSDTISIAIVSSNIRKIEQAYGNRPAKVVIEQLEPTFDEDRIKEQIDQDQLSGIDYVSKISEQKFIHTKNELRNNRSKDIVVVVSDSTILIERNGSTYAVNRDRNSVEDSEIIQAINDSGKVSFVNSVHFGRSAGNSTLSANMYCDIPLGKQLLRRNEMNLENIKDFKNPFQTINAGFLKYIPDRNGNIITKKVPLVTTHDFEKARPYISGMVSEILDFASRSMNFERFHENKLKKIIAEKPFNTFSFYKEKQKHQKLSLIEYYQKLIDSHDHFFSQVGGNCSLFNLNIASELLKEGFAPLIATFNSYNPNDQEGHSAVLVEEEGISYLFEPGLSIPYPIPLKEGVYLRPFSHNRHNVLAIGTKINEVLVPQINIVSAQENKLRSGIVKASKLTSTEQYLKSLPSILTRLHEKRNLIKIDFHSENGRKTVSFCLNTNEQVLSIGFPNGSSINTHIKDINLDQMECLLPESSRVLEEIISYNQKSNQHSPIKKEIAPNI